MFFVQIWEFSSELKMEWYASKSNCISSRNSGKCEHPSVIEVILLALEIPSDQQFQLRSWDSEPNIIAIRPARPRRSTCYRVRKIPIQCNLSRFRRNSLATLWRTLIRDQQRTFRVKVKQLPQQQQERRRRRTRWAGDTFPSSTQWQSIPIHNLRIT